MTTPLLRFTGWLLTRAGLLRVLLFLMQGWQLRLKDRRPVFPFLRRRGERGFLILGYHRVNDESDPIFRAVPSRRFADQMNVLRRYFNVLPLGELVSRAAVGDIPPKSVAITFDDGYRDNYENAFPVLKDLGLPATIFLVTGVMGSSAPIWHDRAFSVFRRTEVDSLFFRGTKYPLVNFEQRQVALENVLTDLRRLSPQERDDQLDRLAVDLRVPEPSYGRKLSWPEVREMAENGITFGAHTVTHPILTKIPLKDAVREITGSREAIENQLRQSVTLFAYPNGTSDDFNESIEGAVKDAGFLCAVTTIWGANNRFSNPYALRRVGFWGQDARVAALRLGWYGLWG